MDFIVRAIVGPYDGPHDKNITTYHLELADKRVLKWHSPDGLRPIHLKLGEVGTGLCLKTYRGATIPNYKKSAIRIKYIQTKIT